MDLTLFDYIGNGKEVSKVKGSSLGLLLMMTSRIFCGH